MSVGISQQPDLKWHGYTKTPLKVEGGSGYVVEPETAAFGNPWVWRARFPDFHPEADLLLLKSGYHIAYVNVAGMFGSPKAIEIGDRFYKKIVNELGLSPKPVLEGVSRGGLFVYNWALANPDKVSCIYCDTPVCDFKSWPGGLGKGVGAENEWKRCLNEYGLDEDSVVEYANSPIDRASEIANSGIPILHIVSENDEIVPPSENTYVLADKLKSLGHTIRIIKVSEGTKKSRGHHFTHPNPKAVADFIKANTLDVASDQRALLSSAKRVLILGDSITYGGGYVAHFDLWLMSKLGEQAPVTINVGLPSETVSGLSEDGHAGGRFPRPDLKERLQRVLDSTKPDLIIACYGMNCGIYKPFSEERFEAFQNGILGLRTAAEDVGAKIIHVTPPVFDDQRGKHKFSYNDVLGRYSKWLCSQRSQGWVVCDLHQSMTNELNWRRSADPEFYFQKDAVHPVAAGHQFIGDHLTRWFGVEGGRDIENGDRAKLAKLVRERMELRRDAYLAAAGHERPGIRKGLPVNEAETKAHRITEEIMELLNK